MFDRTATTFTGTLLSVLIAGGCSAEPTNNGDRGSMPPEENNGDRVVALNQSCTNQKIGYRVDYPTGWVVNSGDVQALEACQVFDPESAELPERSTSFDESVLIRQTEASYDRVASSENDPTARELSRQSVTINGREAVIVESESTGQALLPEGTKAYRYIVKLDDKALIASTYGVSGMQYERNKQILDRMMRSLSFQVETSQW
jgi:hypothetical protein